jgi:molybdopterin/thiamine biosynthesis adenylyltransferase
MGDISLHGPDHLGLVETPCSCVPVTIVDRHHRQLVLPEVGVAGQRRLGVARVAVVGCGGLGAPVIAQLAAVGVGHLTLCDDDVVEGSNLNRQTLFGVADLGRRKAEAAAAFVARLDPDLAVQARVERVTAAAGARLFADHDVVVDASDGFPTKYLLNDLAVEHDRPLVHGAATAWSGQVLVVPGRRGPCLRCLFPSLPPPGSTPTCRTAGILAPVTGVVGSLQAAAVLRLLLGVSDDAGRFVAVDLKEGGTRTLRFAREPACPACGEHRTARGQRDADYAMTGVCAADDDDDEGVAR